MSSDKPQPTSQDRPAEAPATAPATDKGSPSASATKVGTPAPADKPGGKHKAQPDIKSKQAAAAKASKNTPAPPPMQGATVMDKVTSAGKTVKNDVKSLLGSAAKGAAKGAAAGGAHGAAAGAIKAAGVGLLKTRSFQVVVAVVLLAVLSLGALGLFTIIGAGGLLSGPLQEQGDQEVSEEVVGEESDLEGADHTTVIDMAGQYPVPWQIVEALASGVPGGTTGGGGGAVANVIVPDGMTCPETGANVESGLTQNALLVYRCGAAQFPEITSWGGKAERSNNPNSDHPAGRAVDAMIPNWDTDAGNAFGWDVANWYAANAEALGIRYLIYDAQQWTTTNPEWKPYSHPSGTSNATLDHLDHVHISVFEEGQEQAPASGGSTGGSTSPGGPTGGWGAYGLTEDSGLTETQADDMNTATRYIYETMTASLREQNGQARFLTLSSGLVRDDAGQLSVAVTAEDYSGEVGEFVNEDAAKSASTTRELYLTAIQSLPIDGMNESRAEQVYETALRWYMGLPGNTGGMCVDPTSGSGAVPETLVVSGRGGVDVTLNSSQLQMASLIIGAGDALGISQDGKVIALMTALAESTLQNYANDGSDPRVSPADRAVVQESLDYPYDAIGSDWDSVNAFQQRPSQGWGTVKELMDPTYAANKFYETLQGVDGWESMDLGAAAQAVQRSKYPDRYMDWNAAAVAIVGAVTGTGCANSGSTGAMNPEGWTYPVQWEGVRITSKYSLWRINPATGVGSVHNGTDLAAPQGTPIVAAHEGTIIDQGGCNTCISSAYGISGYYVAIDHGDGIVTTYNHVVANSFSMQIGDHVQAGQQIALVGQTGFVTGPHLHFSVYTGPRQHVDPEKFFADMGLPLPGP